MEIISLGAGVQSSTMALMAARGEITPMPHAAIFADTQTEPKAVYDWLNWLEKQLPFPVHRVTRGNLGEDACRVRKAKKGHYYTKHTVPVYVKNEDGSVGMAKRQCTADHKIVIIQRAINKLRNKQKVRQWIGISRDEAIRMKPSRISWIENIWPLVDAGMTRRDCLAWMEKNGYPKPPRSACVFCPFHNDSEWRRMKDEDPESFLKAIEFEKNYTMALSQETRFRGSPFLHRSCVPLDKVDFRPYDEKVGQGNFFNNECEGMCGV